MVAASADAPPASTSTLSYPTTRAPPHIYHRHFVNPPGRHDGWEYATFFGTKIWSANRGIRCCRRRFWRMTTINQAALDEMEAHAAAADGGGAVGSRDDVLGSLGKSLLASNLSAASEQMA